MDSSYTELKELNITAEELARDAVKHMDYQTETIRELQYFQELSKKNFVELFEKSRILNTEKIGQDDFKKQEGTMYIAIQKNAD
jgi:hypothetical protein